MYANQRVTIHQRGKPPETLAAWRVEVARTGRVRVYLDDPDGDDWNYANPAGVRDFPLGTRICVGTDF